MYLCLLFKLYYVFGDAIVLLGVFMLYNVYLYVVMFLVVVM